MGRSKETYGKKEVKNKKIKKRKEKEKRKLEKKESGKQSFDDMIAYVDENGVIVDTPPDPTKRKEVDLESIEIGVPKKEFRDDFKNNQGIVVKYDEMKGYGFIIDSQTKDSIFFHINDCDFEIKQGDKVEFETGSGKNGLRAKNVKSIK